MIAALSDSCACYVKVALSDSYVERQPVFADGRPHMMFSINKGMSLHIPRSMTALGRDRQLESPSKTGRMRCFSTGAIIYNGVGVTAGIDRGLDCG